MLDYKIQWYGSQLGVVSLAHGNAARQMSAYVELQEAEFRAEAQGYSAIKHQREVGTGYFDAVTQAITCGTSSLTALSGSTEEAQFEARKAVGAAH